MIEPLKVQVFLISVWDVINRTCIYQSAIISSSPFCALALDPFKFCCSLGTEDGRVRVYNLTSAGSTLCEPRLLKLIDIKQLQRQSQQAKSEESASHKIVSSMASWRIKDTRSRSPTIRPNIDVVHSEAIIALHYIGNSVTTNSNLVFVAMTNEFYLFNADSYDLIFKFNFQTPLPLEDALHDNLKTYSVHTASSYRFSNAGQPNALSIMIGNRLGGDVFVLRLYFKRLDHQKPRLEFSEHISANCSLIEIVRALILRNVEGTKWVENILVDCMRTLEEARIFVRSDIELVGLDRLPNSLPGYIRDYFREMWMLKSDEVHFSTLSMVENAQAIVFPTSVLAKKTVITASKVIPVKTSKVIPAGRTGSKDLPVTFHSNVKSSGYTSVPILKMFARPKLKGPATPKPIITVGSSIRACCSYAGKFENKHFEGSIQHGSSVTSVKYHPSGNFLATSSVDRMVRYYKLPISKTKVSRDFSGHNGSVTKVEWGLNASKSYGYLLLSSCTDGITRLWSKDRAEPILEINDAKTVTKSANMYYRDRFIILSCRNLVNIYSYKLEPPDSIDPRLNYNTFALKKSYQIDGHSVTALCSLNSKNSQLVFAASSNRTLNIWDINQGVVTRRINDAHTRAIHHISLPDYLTTSTNPQLFSTAAITDSIKLWDLRQDRAVMHLQGHVNRHANITSAISPCGMYLATGSEDHHCYIYDLRVGLAQKTQKNHGDVVMAVDFNPLSPEILTGTGDGRIHLFKIHG